METYKGYQLRIREATGSEIRQMPNIAREPTQMGFIGVARWSRKQPPECRDYRGLCTQTGSLWSYHGLARDPIRPSHFKTKAEVRAAVVRSLKELIDKHINKYH